MSRRDHRGDEGVQFVIDEETMERLRSEAEAREMEVELLMVKLLDIASRRVTELLRYEAADYPGGSVTDIR